MAHEDHTVTAVLLPVSRAYVGCSTQGGVWSAAVGAAVGLPVAAVGALPAAPSPGDGGGDGGSFDGVPGPTGAVVGPLG